MDKIFYARGKGRVTKALTVYSDGEQYRLHFLILDRTNPSRAERDAGAKEKRFVVLDEEFFVSQGSEIIPQQYPQPELVQQFIVYLEKGKGQ